MDLPNPSGGNEQHVLPLQNFPNGLELSPPALVDSQHLHGLFHFFANFHQQNLLSKCIHLSGDLSIYNVLVVHLI